MLFFAMAHMCWWSL